MGNKYQRWDEEKKKLFIELYPTTDKFEMANIFGISESNVLHKACEFRVKMMRKNGLSEDDKNFIRKHYGEMDVSNLSSSLGVDKKLIVYFVGNSGINGGFKLPWEDWEDKILVEEYRKYPNKYIQENFLPHRDFNSIRTHALNLGLHKDVKVPKKYNVEDVLTHLTDVCINLGRAPMQRELIELGLPSEKTFRRYVGDLSAICESLGYGQNINMFGKSYNVLSNDGVMCASLSEKIITDFLESNHISFTKENSYSEFINDSRCGRRRFDWIINNGEIFVEYFGLYDKPAYKKRADFKVALCKEHGIKLLCLYRSDLKNLHEIFNINP